MKSKLLFFILMSIVLGSLCFCGFTYFGKSTILFFTIEGLTVLCAIIFVILYRKLIKPYQLLTSSMELIKEQDFSTRLRPIVNSEANKLIEIFNKMMDQLRNERLSVREKNRFLDLLIQASPQGVILLDFNERITHINPAGIQLLEIGKPEEVIGLKLNEIPNPFCQKIADLEVNQETIIRMGGVVQYRCSLSSFLDRGASHPFILIEELTHELLATEKKSYEGVIRMMAHEVNNSMGAIHSTLHVICDIANEEETLKEVIPAATASSERCTHLTQFVSNLAEVVKIPEPNKIPTDLHKLLESVVRLSSGECDKRNISIEMEMPSSSVVANVDGIQFEQVFLNIIKNAYEAIENDGKIEIQISDASIQIKNNGPELSDDIQEKLFSPFFTTKSHGQGIGLMFVREVLLNHQFRFDFYSTQGWTIFEIDLK